MERKKVRKKRFSKKLLSYSAAAGATLALVGIPNAEAAPVYTEKNVILSGDYVYINLDDNETNDFIAHISENDGDRIVAISPADVGNMIAWTYEPPYNFPMAVALDEEAIINSDLFLPPPIPFGTTWLSWDTTQGITWANQPGLNPWPPVYILGAHTVMGSNFFGNFVGQRGYIGALFEGGSPHYAWLDIQLSADLAQLTIHGWAYESDFNTPIVAGSTSPIPEPGTLILLAIGAAGLIDWRRRRGKVKE